MILTGVAINGGNPFPFPPGDESGSYNVLFDATSSSTISHIITVSEAPFVVQAYGLTGIEVVEVWAVGGQGNGQWFTPVFIDGTQVKLTATDNKLVLDASGRYQFRLTAGGLGTVFVAGHDADVATSRIGLGKFVS